MYVYCRSLNLSRPSAFLAGVILIFSGFSLAHLQHLTYLAVVSWTPWLLLFQGRMQNARRDNQRAWVAWLAASALVIGIQFLSGFPQAVLIGLIPYGLVGLLDPIYLNRSSNPVREFWTALGVILSSIMLGVAIAAVQLLPSAELMSLSVRAQELGGDFFTSLSFIPTLLAELVFPFSQLGQPNMYNQEYWGYVGILPLLLVIWAWRWHDKRVWLFSVFVLGAIILMFGKYTPIYSVLYYIPVFNRFRVPSRFLLLVVFFIAMLAAIGLDNLLRHARDDRSMRLPMVCALPFTLLGIVFLATRDTLTWDFWAEVWAWIPWGLLVISAATLALGNRLMRRSVLVVLILGITITDLMLFAQPFLTWLDRTAPPSEPFQVARPVAAMDSSSTMYRTLTTIYNASLSPNRLVNNRVASALIYSPLALARNEDYLFIMSPAMLNLLNVRYLTQVSYPTDEDQVVWGYSFALDLFGQPVPIPSMRTAQVEIVSYADQSIDVPDNSVAGEIVLETDGATSIRLPIRFGIETADWAHDGQASTGGLKHGMPANVQTFPAFLPASGEFDGHKYVARFTLTDPATITSIRAQSNLPDKRLVIEHVSLIDDAGRATSIAQFVQKDEMSLVFKSHAVAMFENRSVLPRAFIVHQAERVSDKDILARMRQSDFHPEQVVFLDEAPILDSLAISQSTKDDLVITAYKPEYVAIQVRTDQKGYLILTDSFYPGWVASMDGDAVPIYRADSVFRAVQVAPGEHTIVFEFRPSSFYYGAVISMFSLCLCVVFAILGLKSS
jgi:hypothetical protein